MICVFVSTFNRLETLQRSILSFRAQDMDYEVVVVDNGTDHPKCLALLEDLLECPEVKKVWHGPKITSMEELTRNISGALQDDFMLGDGDAEWYAVTDADICFEGSDPRSFEAYIRLALEKGTAAGPHLRVDKDIGRGYPLRNRVLAAETWMLYRDRMEWCDTIPFSRLPIDTTFHLFQAQPTFNRLRMHTVRVGHPYDAMHLDWYQDAFNPTLENEIYIPSGWSWGGSWIKDFWFRFQEDPEKTFEFMMGLDRSDKVLCNTSLVISWCHQMGAGTAVDLEESRRWLRAAVSHQYRQDFRAVEDDYFAFIYDDDFSALGWDA